MWPVAWVPESKSRVVGSWVANFMRGVLRCLFPIFTTAVWTGLLYCAQGRDVLRRILERASIDESINDLFFLAVGSLLLGVSVWYSMRWLLGVQTPALLMSGRAVTRPRTWLPRVFGIWPSAWVAVVYFLPGTVPDNGCYRWLAVGGFAVLAAVTLVCFIKRAQWVGLKAELGRSGEGKPERLHLQEALPDRTFRVLLWTLSLTGFAALLVLMFPLSAPRVMGSAALAALAMASVNLFGSFILTLWPLRVGIPVLAPWVLGAAVLMSAINDNHTSTEDRDATWPGLRPTVGGAFDAWIVAHPDEREIYVVATEGGGIRAAYWTAAVLQDMDTKQTFHLRDRLFAISSVSGGSVGAGVWLATARPTLCVGLPRDKQKEDAATRALSTDFLSPIVGYLFYLDLAQQFLPFPVSSFDRSRGLQGSLQRATANVAGQPLALSASEFYRGCKPMPLLLLNSTRSDTGQRAILTHLDTSDFADIYQARQPRGPSQARPDSSLDHQSMAGLMHHSARFPLVSPAGSVTDRHELDLPFYGRQVRAHLVDGGYYDNSGIVTAVETIRLMQQQIKGRAHAGEYRYHLIILDEDPYWECGRHDDGECVYATDQTAPDASADGWLHEVAPILLGLYNVRDAHVHEAVREAIAASGAWGVSQVNRVAMPPASGPASNEKVEAPLGWALSRSVMREIAQDACNRVKVMKDIDDASSAASAPTPAKASSVVDEPLPCEKETR